jgi:peptide-methionine (S)-S-oxide reductase
MPENKALEVATLGGGCFWCLEAVFEQLKGVEAIESGYSGGAAADPTYQQVCSGTTGHAEVVRVTFDPAAVSYREVLEAFFAVHDPTTLDRQGHDVGTQYRSVIFTHSDDQKAVAEALIRELDAAGIWPGKIVTRIEPAGPFYKAEGYHQGYFRANPTQPYCMAVVSPKVAKFRQKFADKLVRQEG